MIRSLREREEILGVFNGRLSGNWEFEVFISFLRKLSVSDERSELKGFERNGDFRSFNKRELC